MPVDWDTVLLCIRIKLLFLIIFIIPYPSTYRNWDLLGLGNPVHGSCEGRLDGLKFSRESFNPSVGEYVQAVKSQQVYLFTSKSFWLWIRFILSRLSSYFTLSPEIRNLVFIVESSSWSFMVSKGMRVELLWKFFFWFDLGFFVSTLMRSKSLFKMYCVSS